MKRILNIYNSCCFDTAYGPAYGLIPRTESNSDRAPLPEIQNKKQPKKHGVGQTIPLTSIKLDFTYERLLRIEIFVIFSLHSSHGNGWLAVFITLVAFHRRL